MQLSNRHRLFVTYCFAKIAKFYETRKQSQKNLRKNNAKHILEVKTNDVIHIFMDIQATFYAEVLAKTTETYKLS